MENKGDFFPSNEKYILDCFKVFPPKPLKIDVPKKTTRLASKSPISPILEMAGKRHVPVSTPEPQDTQKNGEEPSYADQVIEE